MKDIIINSMIGLLILNLIGMVICLLAVVTFIAAVVSHPTCFTGVEQTIGEFSSCVERAQ